MMKSKTEISNRLINYSLLAMGIIASSNSAQGQIIYTDLDPDINLTEDGEWKYIDLNNDGLDDVGFQYTIFTTSSWATVLGHLNIDLPGENKIAVAYDDPCLLYNSLYGMTCTFDAVPVGDVFQPGDFISADNDWAQIDRLKYFFDCGPYGDFCSQGFFNDEFGLPDEQFLGFRILDPVLNYGWVRLYWEDDELYITGYAHESSGIGLHINVPEVTDLEETLKPDLQCHIKNHLIYLHSNTEINKAGILIFDLSGKLVCQTEFSGTDLIIPFNYDTGIYILKLLSAEFEITEKLMKK